MRKVGVETGVDGADAAPLVALLFDGLIESLRAGARRDLRAGQVDAEGPRHRPRRAHRRRRPEGRARPAQPAASSPRDLRRLYALLCVRLTQANLHNDEAALDECQRLIEPLRDAWRDDRARRTVGRGGMNAEHTDHDRSRSR